MHLKNTTSKWGFIALTFHWLSAVIIFFLFGLGLYMVELDYYDPWYQKAPFVHRSMGILLFGLILARLMWRWLSISPEHLVSHQLWERRLATTTHGLLYLLMMVLMVSGYFISTADGRSIDVFGWFSVPAVITGVENLEDYAGEVHEWTAYGLMGLASLHIAGALKHHFLDKDATLRRMLGM